MNRIAIPAIESVTADIHARGRKIADWRVSKTFRAL
jgi:hypothetical protein